MRTLFCLILLQIAFTAGAQTVKPAATAKPFKVTLAGGYASPVDKSGNKSLAKAGFVYSIEPQYELIKNVEVGLRIEQAMIQRPEFLDNVLYYQSKAKSIISAALTASYVLTNAGSLKPYLGVGVGFYHVDASEQQNSTVHYPLPVTNNIGGLARVGVRFGVVHVEAAYNLIGDTSVKTTASGLTLTAINSYFSLKAGIRIGGGTR